MRHTPAYLLTDPAEVRRIVAAHPWATFVSNTDTGLVASHYPAILDPDATDDELVIVSHFGRPDDQLHELGRHELLVIVQGPHDYVSSSWYDEGDIVPTWDHVTAHLYGTPEILSDDENYRMLERLVDHFEHGRPDARSLDQDEAASRRLAKGTVGIRMRITRYDARAKLSQGKPAHVRERIAAHYDRTNPALAAELRSHAPRP